jgi:hypothetical protein
MSHRRAGKDQSIRLLLPLFGCVCVCVCVSKRKSEDGNDGRFSSFMYVHTYTNTHTHTHTHTPARVIVLDLCGLADLARFIQHRRTQIQDRECK